MDKKVKEVKESSFGEALGHYSQAVHLGPELSEQLSDITVPETKDGKPNIEALIKNILSSGQKLASSHTFDPYDPTLTPDYENIATGVFKTLEKAVRDGNGKLREAAKTALTELYSRFGSDFIRSRISGYITRQPDVEDAKKFGISMAEMTGNYHLVESIKKALTQTDVARVAAPAINDYVGKLQQAYQIKGSTKDIADKARAIANYSVN